MIINRTTRQVKPKYKVTDPHLPLLCYIKLHMNNSGPCYLDQERNQEQVEQFAERLHPKEMNKLFMAEIE